MARQAGVRILGSAVMVTAPPRLTDVTGGEVVVAALALHDVDLVFGIPGTHNLSVFDALTRYGVRTVATTHEQGSGYAADGYARTSGRPGVAVVTSGPAVYNAATAVAQAYSDSIPLLLVSPGMPRDLPTGGPGSGYLHEAKDQTGVMDRIAARCLKPVTHQEIADAVAAAFSSFSSGRPRPLHLEVPLDLLDERGDATLVRAVEDAPTAAADSDVTRAARLLAAAERPMIVAGGGAKRAGHDLVAVAELLGAPVASTINGTGAIDDDHVLALGTRLGTPSVVSAADAADVLLVVGAELGNSDMWQGMLSPRGHVVRVDVDPTMANVNITADTMLVGDATTVMRQLHTALVGCGCSGTGVPDWAADLRAASAAEAAAGGARWRPWIDAIGAARSPRSVVVSDNAMCVYFGTIGILPMHEPASFHFPTGFGTLGFTVPVAVGSALAAPDRQVIGITGDGGLLFTVTELSVAAAERLPMAIVVFDNSGYGEIRAEMIERDEKPLAVDAPPRDLVLLAQALGAKAMRVDTPDQLVAEIQGSLSYEGPTVIVVAETPPPEGAAR
jgi:thiamine pyrophosphate-dependent acetolactate synthase large subunit-like protein